MVTLRNYESLILERVKKISEADSNWKWSVKSITDDTIKIKWGYLEYLEEKDPCFVIVLKDYDEEDDEYFLVSRTPYGAMIEGHMVSITPTKSWQETFEGGIFSALEEISDYAHHVY